MCFCKSCHYSSMHLEMSYFKALRSIPLNRKMVFCQLPPLIQLQVFHLTNYSTINASLHINCVSRQSCSIRIHKRYFAPEQCCIVVTCFVLQVPEVLCFLHFAAGKTKTGMLSLLDPARTVKTKLYVQFQRLLFKKKLY